MEGPSYSDTDLLYRPPDGPVGVPEALLYSDPSLPYNEHSHFLPSQNLYAASSELPSHEKINIKAEKDTSLKSAMEIRNQHYQKQKQYAEQAKKRERHITGIDFEGILNLIGGCSRWQVLIYLFISAQQVPHAMFNLSVVYMMYKPDHWCRIPSFNEKSFKESPLNFTWEQVLSSSVAFPQQSNKQRGKEWHSQCSYYERDYNLIKTLSWQQVENISSGILKSCTEWEYDTSVMKKTVVTEWNRVCDNNWSRAHVHLSYSLGYLVGCYLGGMVSDSYGRRTAIYGFSILSAIFGFLLIYSKEFEIFLIIRFLLAASNEAADLAAYVLCMEVTGVRYRSIVGSLLQAPWALGYALLALVAYLSKSWDTIQMVTVVMHLLSIVLLHLLPESPRWLIMMDKAKDAEPIIRKACQMNQRTLPSDLGLVRHAEKQKLLKDGQQPSFIHLFKTKELRVRYGTLLLIWIVTALVYYGLVIALSDQSSPGRSVFDGNFFLNNAIAGAIEFPTLFVCVFLLNFGRKKSQMITLVGAGILILVAMLAASHHRSTLALVFMLLGKACIQGAFNILYIFTSELSPTVVRNRAVGVSSMMARMGAGASGYIAILSDVTLAIVPMLIFAVFSLFAGVLVMFLPETQHLPLPDTIWDAILMKTRTKPCSEELVDDGHLDEVYRPTPPQEEVIETSL